MVSVLFAAAPESRLKLAMPPLTLVRVDPQVGVFYAEHLAQQLKFAGADVVTSKEIGAMLGMERQRQLLGCSEESSSCLAEMASALGADGIVLGDIAAVGDATQINLKIVSSSDATTLAAYSASAANEKGVLERLSEGAMNLARGAGLALGRKVVPRTAPASQLWLIPAGAGAAALVVGTGFLVDARSQASMLAAADPDSQLSRETARAVATQGSTHQTVGAVLVSAGAVAIGVGAVMFFAGRSSGTSVAVIPFESGGVFAVSGVLP